LFVVEGCFCWGFWRKFVLDVVVFGFVCGGLGGEGGLLAGGF
jgi:hypothetical protein